MAKFTKDNIQFGAKLAGIGRGLPEKVVTNNDLEKLFETTDDWIIQRTGIKERRVVDPDKNETAVSLGVLAAKDALRDAQANGSDIKAEDIDLIICATATGDNLFPSTACMIQHELGAVNAAAFDISAACTGFVYGISTGFSFISNGIFKNVLVIAVDLMSKFVDWSDRRSAIIFGDGAGAAVLSATSAEENNIKSFYIKSKGDAEGALFLPNVCSQYPLKAEDNDKGIGVVSMDGQAVYHFAVKTMPSAIKQACEEAGIEPTDLDYVIPHQANQRITESAAKRLKIPLEKFIMNIDRYGNTSAASIPIAFSEALEQGKISRNGKKLKIAMVGFGAGLTWGASVIEF